MVSGTSSRNSSFSEDRRPIPEAQGQAALLLVESLIHGLLDNGALTKGQALTAIDSAMEVKEESRSERKEPLAHLTASLTLLDAMRRSIDAHSGRYDAEGSSDDADRDG